MLLVKLKGRDKINEHVLYNILLIKLKGRSKINKHVILTMFENQRSTSFNSGQNGNVQYVVMSRSLSNLD